MLLLYIIDCYNLDQILLLGLLFLFHVLCGSTSITVMILRSIFVRFAVYLGAVKPNLVVICN
jgi:hypothetical protein